MLLGFGAKNFFCFKEGIEVSLKLKPSSPALESNGSPFVDVLCVKGANGSGKTNLLKIISFFNFFCCHSFGDKPENPIASETYFDCEQPSSFYIDFIIKKTQYRYELILNKKEVIKETIYRKKNRFIPIVERNNRKETKCIKEFDELKIIKLRTNASIISTAHQYEIDSFSDIYDFFNKIISNVNLYGIYDKDFGLSYISELYSKEKKLFNFVKKLIIACDLGIHDIKIKKIKDEEDADIYFPIFYYKNQDSTKALLFQNQSSGTKALYNQLWIYKVILEEGGVLVLDEFDINLHPHMLPILLELFFNKKTNKKNAQLLFTTHNTKIIDTLGKYKVFFVNKDDNESFGYRLDEIPGEIIRNDRPISPIYDAGKIGGVPRL